MRRAAERLIRNDPRHPLRFLLDERGRFKQSRGLSHAELANRPDLIQMGHIESHKLRGEERLMLQGAWENQFMNVTVEAPSIGGAVLERVAIDIGGIAVDAETAKFWEKIGWLPKGTIEKAPRL
jgi:Bacterial toxin 5